MRPSLSKKEERILYWAALILLLTAVLIFIAEKVTGKHLYDFMPPCLFLSLTGLYCPGCGGTRAIRFLLQGQLIKSLLYHPLVPYTAVLGGWYLISHTVELVSKGKYPVGMRYRDVYLYGALGLVLINWTVKNLFILLCGIHLLQ